MKQKKNKRQGMPRHLLSLVLNFYVLLPFKVSPSNISQFSTVLLSCIWGKYSNYCRTRPVLRKAGSVKNIPSSDKTETRLIYLTPVPCVASYENTQDNTIAAVSTLMVWDGSCHVVFLTAHEAGAIPLNRSRCPYL